MVIAAVDQGDFNARPVAQHFGGVESGESSSDDDDSLSAAPIVTPDTLGAAATFTF